MSDARTHAIQASELLDSLDRLTEHVKTLSPERRFEMMVTGKTAEINDSIEFVLRLSKAHSLAALALVHTEVEIEVPE